MAIWDRLLRTHSVGSERRSIAISSLDGNNARAANTTQTNSNRRNRDNGEQRSSVYSVTSCSSSSEAINSTYWPVSCFLYLCELCGLLFKSVSVISVYGGKARFSNTHLLLASQATVFSTACRIANFDPHPVFRTLVVSKKMNGLSPIHPFSPPVNSRVGFTLSRSQIQEIEFLTVQY